MSEMMSLPSAPPRIDDVLADAGLKTGGPTKRGHSFWSAFQLCPYDARMIELFGHIDQASSALVIGILVHECFAQWYQSYDVNRAMEPVRLVKVWAESHVGGEHGEFASMVWASCVEAEKLVSMYVGRPHLRNEILSIDEIKNAEFDFPPAMVRMVETPITYNGLFEYSARMDLVVEAKDVDGTSCVVIVDHKTTRSYTTSWTDAFWLDMQFVGLPFLWNEVMVPQGYPECRYVVANGIVKDAKTPKDRFVREVFPLRDNQMTEFKVAMAHTFYRYSRMLAAEQQLEKQMPVQSVWPRQHASCQSRRYGRKSAGRLPNYDGDIISDGGRCPRYEQCLYPDSYVEMIGQVPALKLDVVEETNVDIVEESRVDLVATQTSPQPDHGTSEGQHSQAKPTEGEVCPKYRFPIPESVADIVSFSRASEPMKLGDVPVGEMVYMARAGVFYWVSGKGEDGNILCETVDCPAPIGFSENRQVWIIEPVYKNAPVVAVSTDAPNHEDSSASSTSGEEPPAPSTEVAFVLPEGCAWTHTNCASCEKPQFMSPSGISCENGHGGEDSVDGGDDAGAATPETTEPVSSGEKTMEHVDTPPYLADGSNAMAASSEIPEEQKIRGRKLGVAPLPGVGMVDVLYLGSFTKGGTRLQTYAAGLCDGAFYGAALVGRDVDKRKLTLVAFGDEVEIVKKSSVGAIVWDAIDAAAHVVEGEK